MATPLTRALTELLDVHAGDPDGFGEEVSSMLSNATLEADLDPETALEFVEAVESSVEAVANGLRDDL